MFGQNDVHVMVDIETAGTNPGDIILQVGAVAFTLGDNTEILEGKNEYFKIGISVEDSKACGFTTDSNTLTWWSEQDTELRHQVWGGTASVSQFLYAFIDYLAQFGDKDNIYIWANDPDFDCTLIKAYYVHTGLDDYLPWNFRNNRSFRTVKALYPELYEEAKKNFINDTKHGALTDAIWQAKVIRHILLCRSQAEIAKRSERIKELEEQNDTLSKNLRMRDWIPDEQAAEISRLTEVSRTKHLEAIDWAGRHQEATEQISRLKGVIAKCNVALTFVKKYVACAGDGLVNESLAAIKEIE